MCWPFGKKKQLLNRFGLDHAVGDASLLDAKFVWFRECCDRPDNVHH